MRGFRGFRLWPPRVQPGPRRQPRRGDPDHPRRPPRVPPVRQRHDLPVHLRVHLPRQARFHAQRHQRVRVSARARQKVSQAHQGQAGGRGLGDRRHRASAGRIQAVRHRDRGLPRAPVPRGPRQEPLRRPHVHHARPAHSRALRQAQAQRHAQRVQR